MSCGDVDAERYAIRNEAADQPFAGIGAEMHPIRTQQRLVTFGVRTIVLPDTEGFEEKAPLAGIVGQQRHGRSARAYFDIRPVEARFFEGAEHDLRFLIRPSAPK